MSALEVLGDLPEHIQRQDRLLSAAEKAKEGFRKTINQLQATIKERDATIEELKGMLRDLGGDV